MTKIRFTPLLTHTQGCQGCQKIRKTKLKTTLVSWIAKIQPKLNKILKTFRKQFLFNFDNFSQFFQFWLNLSAPTHQNGLQFFDTPGTPGVTSIVK